MLIDTVPYVTSKIGKIVSLGRPDSLRTPGHVQKCWYQPSRDSGYGRRACQKGISVGGVVPVSVNLCPYVKICLSHSFAAQPRGPAG